MAREVSSKTIDGITDLVVVAPIKPGMIEAFENITFETRLKLVAEALHKIRVNAREHELVGPYADTVERILTLFNFRIGVLDRGFHELSEGSSAGEPSLVARRYMFLVATFDGPFEPYMRLIWKPLGPFLDLLLCNCVDYKLATGTGYPEYIDWVRRHQVEPSIFYSTSGNTLRDQIYLADLEKMQRESDPALGHAAGSPDGRLARMTLQDPAQKAEAVWQIGPDPVKSVKNIKESLRLSFEALNVLYRLADYFPPDRESSSVEGDILIQAAQELLPTLRERIRTTLAAPNVEPFLGFKKTLTALGVTGNKAGPLHDQWRWFCKEVPAKPIAAPSAPDDKEIQKGLLTGFDGDGRSTSRAMMMHFAVTDRQAAAQFIQWFLQPSWEAYADPAEDPTGVWPHIYKALAFTASGLRAMGVPESDYQAFPKEFRDGLFKRAPLIGDVRDSHPRRWKMPARFDTAELMDDAERPSIHTEEIDLVAQFRQTVVFGADREDLEFRDFENQALSLESQLNPAQLRSLKSNIQSHLQGHISPGAAIFLAIDDDFDRDLAEKLNSADFLTRTALFLKYAADFSGLSLLAVESSFRPLEPNSDNPGDYDNRDHFGFVDGLSQPQPSPDVPNFDPCKPYDNKIEYGELFVGHKNGRGDSADQQNWDQKQGLQHNGSFMVLRKIAQYPDRFDAIAGSSDLDEVIVKQAMVGRTAQGEPLIKGAGQNDFTYQADKAQAQCPFSAHVRLANPRDEFQGRRAPRILRRGMSYGEKYDAADPVSAAKPRGIMFVAYMASIAEQYEVIQRWLNGGNPTGVSSAANDPLTGAAQEPGDRTFRFFSPDGKVRRVVLPESKPVTEVQWGLYAFVPSRSALEMICTDQLKLLPEPQTSVGQGIIKRIERLPEVEQRREWKRLLEDFSVKDTADQNLMPEVWRAIRIDFNGAMRLKHGVAYEGEVRTQSELTAEETPVILVASWPLIEQVLSDPEHFSVSEQGARTRKSFGAIYVSMDPDPNDAPGCPVSDYAKESEATNRVVYDVSQNKQSEVFNEAYRIARERLEQVKLFNSKLIGERTFYKIELRRDFLVPVLGKLCTWLFDIPDTTIGTPGEGYIELGPWGWEPIDPSAGTVAAEEMRKPRCPGDFMAPSRYSFYPRPSASIQDYGTKHGLGLRAASLNLIKAKRNTFKGLISQKLAELRFSDDLLARNIIGNMEGMLPPTDGIMRGIFYEWIDRDEMWRNQSRYLEGRDRSKPATLEQTYDALRFAVETAMCKRPAPDLLYRTATKASKIGDVEVNAGDTVILGLVAPMLESLEKGSEPFIEAVFGGERGAAWQPAGMPTHACPAYHMVMAMVYGMIAALFDSGRIVVQPASLILRISDWPGAPPPDPVLTANIEELGFSPYI
jgi:Dyp-type peroxidase family